MITGESKVHQIIGLKSLPNALSIRCLGNGQRIRRDDENLRAGTSQQAGAGILRRFLPVQVGRPKQPLPSFF